MGRARLSWSDTRNLGTVAPTVCQTDCGVNRTVTGRQPVMYNGYLGKAHGSFFPLRGVLRVRVGVRRLRNLERARRRDPTGGGWRSTVVVAVIREQRRRKPQRFYFDSHVPRGLLSLDRRSGRGDPNLFLGSTASIPAAEPHPIPISSGGFRASCRPATSETL
jgi:hypothetical protein